MCWCLASFLGTIRCDLSYILKILKDIVKDNIVDKCPLFQNDFDGTVIRAKNFRMNIGRCDFLFQNIRDQNVVDSPTDVAGTGVCEMRPPRIETVAFMKEAERVDESNINEVLKTLAFLIGETFQADIFLWSSKIVRRMGYVQVTAEYDWLALFELFAIGQKGRIPLLVAKGDAAQIVLCVRSIDGHQPKIAEFSGDDAALGRRIAVGIRCDAEFLAYFFRQAVDDRERLYLCKDRRARIALFMRGIPILLVARQNDFGLTLLGLCFLKTENVRLIFFNKRKEQALFMHRADAVDVPGDDFHAEMIAYLTSALILVTIAIGYENKNT